MQDLKERAIRGGFARMFAQAATFVIRIGSLMALARLLDPKDFGLVGMVTAVIGVLSLFRDFGLSTATIQQPNVTDEQFSTLFWINIAVGVLLAIISIGIAPLVARFYHDPRLVWVTIALAATFILNAAGVQHGAILQRQMRFPVLATIDVVSLVVSTAIGIGMAMKGFGYWSLVAMNLMGPIVTAIAVWVAARWIPGRPRRGIGLGSMMRFGGTVTVNGIIMYAAYNVDNLLIGRFWGAEALGIYGRAYQLIKIPGDNLNSAVGALAFSTLARVQDETARLKSFFLKGYSIVLGLALPATIFCGIFGNDLVLVILGPKWREAAPVFRLLAPGMLVLSIISPFSWLLCAIGKVRRSLNIALVLGPLATAAYFLGLSHGPKGVAVAYSIAMIVWLVPHIAWSVHRTPISFLDVVLVSGRPLLAGFVAGALAFGMQSLYGTLVSVVVRLVLEALLFAAVYFGILLYGMGQKAFYFDLIKGMIRRSQPEEQQFAIAQV